MAKKTGRKRATTPFWVSSPRYEVDSEGRMFDVRPLGRAEFDIQAIPPPPPINEDGEPGDDGRLK